MSALCQWLAAFTRTRGQAVSQKIPRGYQLVRMRNKDLFSFTRDDRVPGATWLSKRDALDAIWQDFRTRAVAAAYAQGERA